MSDEDDEEDNKEHPKHLSWKLRAILVFVLIWQFRFTIPDVAVLVVLLFIFRLFKLMNINLGEGLSAGKLPKTLQSVYKLLGIDNNNFTEYIVCPKCNAVLDYDKGYEMESGKKTPRRCPRVHYPNHPHLSGQEPCGAYLMRVAKTRSGKVTVKPYKVYPYQSLKQAITNLLNREGVLDHFDQCSKRSQLPSEGLLCDIYDGQVWKHFQTVDETRLLGSCFNIGFTLNTDWFQPFSRTRKI